MTCTCGAETRVLETRTTDAGIRRRRGCSRLGCKETFATVEMRVASVAKVRAAVREIGELLGDNDTQKEQCHG